MADRSHPLREVLNQVSVESCPGGLNFHCHTHAVMEAWSLALAQQAQNLGLQHLAVTDHHSTAAYLTIQEYFMLSGAWLRCAHALDRHGNQLSAEGVPGPCAGPWL